MTVIKIDTTRKIKWYVMDENHETIAGFTTKKAANEAMESYKKMGFK